MKSGFHTDLPPQPEPQREDQNIPLRKFGGANTSLKALARKFELPDQYLRTCTLREGTIITMVIYQTMSLGTCIVLAMFLVFFPKETDYWWKEKFRNDLDYYYQDENEALQEALHPLWRPLCYACIAVHFLFFMTGWLVVFGLAKKNAHPCWYMPWIIVSCFLSTVHWLVCATMVVTTFIFGFLREISVTWDLVPIACTVAYGVGWTYSCAVVIAHYKRRTIVRYWRGRQHLLGMENYPPQITEYLYQYGSKTR